MAATPEEFYPFYDPYRGGKALGYTAKVAIALGLGCGYMLLQFLVMEDKTAFFQQSCWLLGAIISVTTLAVYMSTQTFRNTLHVIFRFEGNSRITDHVVRHWLNDRNFILAALVWATINTGVGHLLGVPPEFHSGPWPLAMIYLGFFVAGLINGIGLLAVSSVVMLYLRFAPNLHHTLDPDNPDGTGGIKSLGDSLWMFGGLIGTVALLVTAYMINVDWTFLHRDSVRWLFVLWIALPYILAISVVLIPGLAIRRQVSEYKNYRAEQLKQEKARLYSSYKEFNVDDDDAIIENKKILKDKLNDVQEKMEKLRRMRKSHLDMGDKS